MYYKRYKGYKNFCYNCGLNYNDEKWLVGKHGKNCSIKYKIPFPQFKFYNPRRKAGYPYVLGDCAVRAICKLTGGSYESVYKTCMEYDYGRYRGLTETIDDGGGVDDRAIVKILCGYFKFTLYDFQKENVRAENILVNKDTTMAVGINGHIFAIKKGIIYDAQNWWQSNPRIHYIMTKDDLVLV